MLIVCVKLFPPEKKYIYVYLKVKLKKKKKVKLTGEFETMQVNRFTFLPGEGGAYLVGQCQGYHCISGAKAGGRRASFTYSNK